MGDSVTEILDRAMQMSDADRAEIAERLIASLDKPDPPQEVEAAWQKEIARRLEQIDRGEVECIPQVLYEASLDAHSISGKCRPQQEQSKRLILNCRAARKSGASEQDYLKTATLISAQSSTGDISTGEYFIGCLLEQVNEKKALRHFRKAVSANPANWRAQLRSLWLRLRMAIN